MKTLYITLLGLCLAIPLHAQKPEDSPPPFKLNAAEIEELVGPIALYPDALISLILPASTYPADIVLSARYIASRGDLVQVESMAWDTSVKALTRYPDTLAWLDENLEWTTQLGDAFIEQPVEVMNSIQVLRARAKALGNLVDTPEQRIILDETYIRIIPARPDYIYEPRYDPEVIYYERRNSSPLLYFSAGFLIGSWLNYDFDWHNHRLYRGDYHEGWNYDHDHNHREGGDSYRINNNFTNVRIWQPDSSRYSAQSHARYERNNTRVVTENRQQSSAPNSPSDRKHQDRIARPTAIVGAPHHKDGIKDGNRFVGKPDNRQGVKPGDPRGDRPGNKSGDLPGAKSEVRPGIVPTPPRTNKPKADDIPKVRPIMPKAPAPAMTGDRNRPDDKRSSDEPKKPNAKPEPGIRPNPQIPGKAPGSDIRPDMPRPKGKPDSKPPSSIKPNKPKQETSPARVEPPKETPKKATPRQIAPKQDTPKKVTPRAPSKPEAPKRTQPPQQSAPKKVTPNPSPSKAPAKSSTKEEDKKTKGKDK